MLDNKPKFRSRKLEYHRGLPVYRFDDAIDQDEYNNSLRAVPLIATGVDKEEEDEHHLQVALTTSQVMPKEQSYVIPTPEAAQQIRDYTSIYPVIQKLKKTLIRHTGTIEDLLYERPKYTADAEDVAMLKGKPNDSGPRMTLFEHVIGCFEEAANKLSESSVTVATAVEHFQSDSKVSELFKVVSSAELDDWHRYWVEKRSRLKRHLVLSLKHEDFGKIGSDPYVCFRRRELKQPRKTRRSDAQIMEKVRKIRFDIATCQQALLAGIRRDKWKREALFAEDEAFERYWTLRNWQQLFGIERPPTVPSFRAFHQQVPSFASGSNARGSAASARTKGQQQASRKPGKQGIQPVLTESDLEDEEELFTASGLLRIAIPPLSIRSVKYSRPYYPFEVVKQIQKDMETLHAANDADPLTRDYTGSITGRDDRQTWIVRRTRGGRFVLQMPKRACDAVIERSPLSMHPFHERIFSPTALNHLHSIHARDCAHLNNAFVGNYNQHYLQVTAGLSKPTSLVSWVQATANLAQASDRKKGNGSGGGSGSGNGSGGPEKSPKKRKHAAPEAGEGEKKAKGAAEFTGRPVAGADSKAVISSLTSSPQFTVKVKSTVRSESSDGEGLQVSGSSADAAVFPVSVSATTALPRPTSPPQPQRTKSNAARFTPTGLSSLNK